LNALLSAWNRHEAELRHWLAFRLPVRSEADDLLQDVFLKAMTHAKSFDRVEHPRAWLYEMARNTLIDRLRASRAHEPLPDDLDALPAPEETLEPVDALAQACLARVLSELPAQDREAITLCDLDGMPQAEFARLKNLSLSAAKSRVQRARRRMRDLMTMACQVRFDGAGRVNDFVPREPLPEACCPPQAPGRSGKPPDQPILALRVKK
jgi:RNA polymerase sigma-70 factor (ECF subfamily)